MPGKELVVIPAYQPDHTLVQMVIDLREAFSSKGETCPEIVVVNDGSTSAASLAVFETLKDRSVTLITNERNLGMGGALKRALEYARDVKAERVVNADADGQHLPKDIYAVLAHCRTSRTFTIGVRAFSGPVPLRSRLGNSLTSGLFRAAFQRTLRDTQSGLRSYPSRYFGHFLNISANGYEYQMAALIQAFKLGRVEEVPIETVYEPGNPTSHFRPLVDSAKIYWVFSRYALVVPVAALVDVLTFVALSTIWPAVIAFAVGRAASSVLFYTAAERIIFRPPDQIRARGLKYAMLVAVNMIIVTLLLQLAVPAGANATIVYLAGCMVMFLVNFLVQRFFVFS